METLHNAEEDLYRQKSWITWIKNGDQNTAFCHNCVKDRLNRNKIISLTLDDGAQEFDVVQIKHTLVDDFQAILQPPSPSSTDRPCFQNFFFFVFLFARQASFVYLNKNKRNEDNFFGAR